MGRAADISKLKELVDEFYKNWSYDFIAPEETEDFSDSLNEIADLVTEMVSNFCHGFYNE
jgi:hypothetical protein